MARIPGTSGSGRPFDLQTIQAVWTKAKIIRGFDPAHWRQDACGAWIEWAKYGDTVQNGSGWEIDHIMPVSRGGSDHIANLQPLQWQNNRTKGDNYPNWSYAVRAS